MNKHTPGPWDIGYAQGDDVVIVGPDRDLEICTVWSDRGLHDTKLIAAAPDLLEALDKLTDWAESLRVSGDAGNWEWEDDEYTQAIAALNKARGQA